ncbi:MAG: alpha/beta hydrolase [Planctomycetota bacterium]
MPVIDVVGTSTRLAYDLQPGDPAAPTLVYCHGLLSSRGGERADMLEQWCAARAWSCLRFDFQGRGGSSGSLADITLSRQLGDLGAILGLLPDGARPVLFGSSFGGLTAAWYAAQHPEQIRACVLLAPAFGFIDALLTKAGLTGALHWRDTGTLEFEAAPGVAIHYDLVADAAGYPDLLLAQSLRTPTLVFHGRDDPTVPYKRSVAFAEAADAVAALQLFRHGDHLLYPEMPQILGQVDAFVNAC